VREEKAAGLEALAALIRGNPAVKVGDTWASHTYQYCADSEDEVTGIAAALGVTPGWDPEHTHYGARLKLPGGVEYLALYITRDHMARYYAATTYSGCVEPEVPALAPADESAPVQDTAAETEVAAA
jgi:hypothetical protein